LQPIDLQRQINRLQKILNASARLIFGDLHIDHVTLLLRDKLHWLRCMQRITYKLFLIIYKALHQRSPTYIRALVVHVSLNAATARLRSPGLRTQAMIVCPRVHHKYVERGFGYAGPSAWNSLSPDTRLTPSLEMFKTKLKTNLFVKSYS